MVQNMKEYDPLGLKGLHAFDRSGTSGVVESPSYEHKQAAILIPPVTFGLG